jgi:opacity protein-like surface antigen
MIMKKLILSFMLSTVVVVGLFAQEEEEEQKGGWKKDHLFIGTSLNLGFSNGFIIGLNPEIGYSINKFIDAGISTNFNYVTQRYQNVDASLRYMAIGGGPFVRVWPARMIFLGGQYEYNRIKLSEKIGNTVTYKENHSASSMLVGVGYGSRMIGESQFFVLGLFFIWAEAKRLNN